MSMMFSSPVNMRPLNLVPAVATSPLVAPLRRVTDLDDVLDAWSARISAVWTGQGAKFRPGPDGAASNLPKVRTTACSSGLTVKTET